METDGPQDSQTGSVSLADLAEAWNLKSTQLDRQTQKANEYGEIVLWHRWVDANLTEALRSKFVPETKGAADLLFKYPGGLAFFAARAHLGRCLGLYGGTTYADLKISTTYATALHTRRMKRPGNLNCLALTIRG
jgi:hypothetical protein